MKHIHKFWKHFDGDKKYSYFEYQEQERSRIPALLLSIGFVLLAVFYYLGTVITL